MKHTKRFLAVVLCMLLMLTPLVTVAETVTVHAADTQTVKVKKDKKTGKRYGYDKNNQKVINQWGVTAGGFRYYFGKDGAAYQYEVEKELIQYQKYQVLVKKIKEGNKSNWYAFDINGHMVTGVCVGTTSTDMYSAKYLVYYFDEKTGKKNDKKTAEIRKYGTLANMSSRKSASKIKQLLGKPKKTIISDTTCFIPNGKGVDVTYIYDRVTLSVYRPTGQNAKNRELLESLTAREG